MIVRNTNSLLTHSQSIQLLFDENVYWRKLCLVDWAMETIEYYRFWTILQESLETFVECDIRFKISSRKMYYTYFQKDLIEFERLWLILCKSYLDTLLFADNLRITHRVLVGAYSNTLNFFIRATKSDQNNVPFSIERIEISPVCTSSADEVSDILRKFTDRLAKVSSEQKILEDEITNSDRLDTIATVMQYDLDLPDVIVVCMLQYLRNVTVINRQGKLVLVND